MSNDIHQQIASSSMCTQAKVPFHFPVGTLMHLATPLYLWSHITLDNTIVLVVMDRFSHAIKLVPRSPFSSQGTTLNQMAKKSI